MIKGQSAGGAIMSRHPVLESVIAVLAVLHGLGIFLLLRHRLVLVMANSISGGSGGFSFAVSAFAVKAFALVVIALFSVVFLLALFLWRR
jgi:hypothetical protein